MEIKPPTYPARPINGGPLEKSLPKSAPTTWDDKYNGWNVLVHLASRACYNRKLEPLSITAEFKPALEKLRGTLDCAAFKWVNCEGLERRHNIGRGTLIVYDVLPEPEYRQAIFTERRAWLNAVLPPMNPIGERPCGDNEVRVARSWIDPQAAWIHLQAENKRLGCPFYEGLVAKRNDSVYPFQLRSPEVDFPFWMKHRWAF
jgi:hypothetical protein